MITTIGATEQAQEPSPAPSTQGLSPDQLDALKRLVLQRESLDPEKRATVETLAKKYGISMNPVKGFVEQDNPGKEIVEGFGHFLKNAALPMSGQMGGLAAGNALLPPGPLKVAGTLALGGLGGLLGTKGNEWLGISKPNDLDYLLSAVAPSAGQGIAKTARKMTPGVAAAEQKLVLPAMKGLAETIPGGKAATDAAYQRVRDLGPVTVPTPEFKNTVNKLLQNEVSLSKFGEHAGAIKGRLTKTSKELDASSGTMSFDDMSGLLKRYRERAASAESTGGEKYGLYKDLRRALFTDMDTLANSAQGAHAVALREAMGEAKKRLAKEELADVLSQHGTDLVTKMGQTFEVTQPTRVMNVLKSMEWGAGLPASVVDNVNRTLREIAKAPHPDVGLRSGMGTTGRVLATTAASGAAGLAGGPLGAVGTAAAAATGFAVHDAIARLLMSDSKLGREFLVKLFKRNQGKVGPNTSGLIQFMASQLQDPGDE